MDFRLKILTPTTGSCKAAYTFSLANLVMYYMQNRIYSDTKDQWLGVNPVEGSGISANRERLVVDALKTDVTHILFIDEDMGFCPNTLHVLASKSLPLVACNYKMRIKGKGFTALGLNKKSRIITTEESKGVEECYYAGFGFCLIKREVFEKTKKPWFLIGYNTDVGSYTTEDCGFARQLEDTDIKWYIDHDASKLVWHVGNYNYKWNED